MSTYTTIQGDTFDGVAYKVYGSEKYMGLLAQGNIKLIDTLVFPAGVVLNVPDIPEDSQDDAPFWKSDEPVDEGYYEYEVVGDDEDLTDADQDDDDEEEEEEE